MAKLSMPGGMNVADKRCSEDRGKQIKNKGKYDDASQLKSSKPSTPGSSGVGKSWYVGGQKKK